MAFDPKRMSRGKQKLPNRILVHALDGVGKTGFIVGAPDLFLIDANRGSDNYDVKQRYIPDSWDTFRDLLNRVENGGIKCRTVGLDATTDLYALCLLKLFPGSNIEEDKFKGKERVLTEWREIIAQLERIRLSGKTVAMTAHTSVKRFSDPMVVGGYDRYELALLPELAGMLRQWCDFVLFAKEETILNKDGRTNKATTSGVRYAYTRRSPAYDAKARGSALFPERIALSWRALEEAIEEDNARLVTMSTEVETMLKELGDAQLTKTVNDWLSSERDSKIVDTHNRITVRLAAKREASVVEPAAQETQTEAAGTV